MESGHPKQNGRNVSSRHIMRKAKHCGVIHPTHLSIEDCIQERQLAEAAFKKSKKARSTRKLF